MKTLFLTLILAGIALAQDVNGVSLAGTPDNPTIVNHGNKPVIGFTVARFNADGARLPSDRIVLVDELMKEGRRGIMPGESQAPQVHNVINFSSRGTAVKVSLDSVLFEDGEVVGPDTAGPEFSALEGFTHQLANIRQDYAPVPRVIYIPNTWSKPTHNTIQSESASVGAESSHGEGGESFGFHAEDLFLTCNTNFGCWPIRSYCCDASAYGLTFGTPTGVETPIVGGTAVCDAGSPYEGYGIGDRVNATVFCPNPVLYVGISTEASRRTDLQMDRIIQSYKLYNDLNSNLQNSAQFHELCAYAQLPNRGGQGPFGKAVVEFNYKYGCP